MEYAFQETKQITIPSQNDSIHQCVRALVSCGYSLTKEAAPVTNRDGYTAWVTNKVTMVCKELTAYLNLMSVSDPMFLRENETILTKYIETFVPPRDFRALTNWYLWNYTAQNSGPIDGFRSLD
jgi:hypothetical protein